MKKSITPTKQVHIIGRIQYKQTGYISYKVKPSTGSEPYRVSCKPDGTVTSCTCDHHVKGHQYCKHMTACQSFEDASREGSSEVQEAKEVKQRRHIAPLHSSRAFSLLAS